MNTYICRYIMIQQFLARALIAVGIAVGQNHLAVFD